MVSRADNVITNTEAGAKPAMAASPQRQRDYLLDNYKALLITLVVMGHFIEPCYQNNDFRVLPHAGVYLHLRLFFQEGA